MQMEKPVKKGVFPVAAYIWKYNIINMMLFK